MPFTPKKYPFLPPPGLSTHEPRHRVAIVGAGPIGLAAAVELSNFDIPTVVLDDNNSVSTGSRAICWSKRSLEIFDRLGIGDRAVAKGVTWKIGRTYHRDREIFNFDLLPEQGHKRPAFINLQQYYVEEYLVDRALSIDLIDLRFSNRVTNVEQDPDGVRIDIQTPEGSYRLESEYLLACDGARSPIRGLMGLEFVGELFEERFLIADIEMEADFPSERRFWFEPTFHTGQSALLHKQPDNIYRIDLQLGWNADPEEEKKPERVFPRIKRMVGTDDFKLDWVSVYAFQCRRLERFIHDRVIFAGDSAHVVSPFGARGGNSGLQDVDNLCWKLAAVLRGNAPESLLETYNSERVLGADENIANSTLTTKFMTPADGIERTMRDQVFKLAATEQFARAWVNSGRLSVPCVYTVNGPDHPLLPELTRPGSVAVDSPQGSKWLLDDIGGDIAAIGIGCDVPEIEGVRPLKVELNEYVRKRYLGTADHAVYLIRPDQIVAARWIGPKAEDIRKAANSIWNAKIEPDVHDSQSSGNFDQIYHDLIKAFNSIPGERHERLAATLLISLCTLIPDQRKARGAIAMAREVVSGN